LQVWPQAKLVGAIDRLPSEQQGITTDLEAVLPGANVMIDFSSPQSTAKNLAAAARHGVAALVGTTGLGSEALAAAHAAAVKVPLIIAANTSLGVTLLQELVRAAAQALPADFDIEIIEGHHRHKKDAPSGTALALGRAAAAGRGQTLESTMAGDRRGESAVVTSSASTRCYSPGRVSGWRSAIRPPTGRSSPAGRCKPRAGCWAGLPGATK
jgi:4-hydroxy-tetrahydrodipicolinate reductase